MPPSGLVLRAGRARLPVAVRRRFTTAHQEDRDTFHERRAATKVDGALSVGADADVDAHAAPVIHSRFRAWREAALPGHPSEIREQSQSRIGQIGQCLDPFVAFHSFSFGWRNEERKILPFTIFLVSCATNDPTVPVCNSFFFSFFNLKHVLLFSRNN